MKRTILALDTSHPKGSVSISLESEVLCEILFDASDTHSATLMPAVDRCFGISKLLPSDIDLIGVVIGPGSFTGLRIGLATAKAFAASLKCPVAPVTSLEALAAAFPFSERSIVPLIDARRREVYGAVYSTVSGFPETILEPFAARPESMDQVLTSIEPHSYLFCGTGASRYRELIEGEDISDFVFANAHWSYPSASVVAMLAGSKKELTYEELCAIEPLYIRPPDAKIPDGNKRR